MTLAGLQETAVVILAGRVKALTSDGQVSDSRRRREKRGGDETVGS